MRAARLAGVPAGIIVGGSTCSCLKDPSRGRAVTSSLKAADAVFAVSRDLRDGAVRAGADPARVHVVYQGVEARFAPGDRGAARDRLGLHRAGALLVWVGRMDPEGAEVSSMRLGLRDGGHRLHAAGRRRPEPAGRGGGGRPARASGPRPVHRHGAPRPVTGLVPGRRPDRAVQLLGGHSERTPRVPRVRDALRVHAGRRGCRTVRRPRRAARAPVRSRSPRGRDRRRPRVEGPSAGGTLRHLGREYAETVLKLLLAKRTGRRKPDPTAPDPASGCRTERQRQPGP